MAVFGPYIFYDVNDGVASEVSSSWCNDLEASLVVQIAKHLLAEYKEHIEPTAIGIISPYNGQVRYLRRLFAESFGADVARTLEVNSVDGFQGREKDLAIRMSATYSQVSMREHRDPPKPPRFAPCKKVQKISQLDFLNIITIANKEKRLRKNKD